MVTLISNTATWRAKSTRRPAQFPSILSFDENCAETLAAFQDLRRRLATRVRSNRYVKPGDKGKRTEPKWMGRYQSFESIRRISPAAALVLAAEYERFRIVTQREPWVANIDRWDRRIARILYQIGFFDIVGFNTEKPDLSDTDFEILPMTSGKTNDAAAVSRMIEELRSLFPSGRSDTGEAMIHLFGAMMEAITNVVGHAYPPNGPFEFNPVGKWWITGAVDHGAGRMTAVVYDQGVTIPVSLWNWSRQRGWAERMMSKLGFLPRPSDPSADGDAISVAVDESMTSTEMDNRGKGLAQMRNFAHQCAGGHLRILSRCGEVVFSPGTKPVVRTYPVPVGGTLIEWNVRVYPEEVHD